MYFEESSENMIGTHLSPDIPTMFILSSSGFSVEGAYKSFLFAGLCTSPSSLSAFQLKYDCQGQQRCWDFKQILHTTAQRLHVA